MPSFTRVVTAPIGGGIVVALLWLFLNGMPGGQRPGWLEQKPWPLSSLVACIAIGAALAFLQALIAWWRSHRHGEDLSSEAVRLRLEYQPTVSRADVGEAIQLRVLEYWHEAWNRLYGRFEGVDLQMIDFTSFERTRRRHDSQSHYNSRTLVIIPLPTKDWPTFELHPRGLSTWMWDLLGCRGVRFRFRERNLVRRQDRDSLARFNRRYRLFIGLAERIAELAGAPMGLPLGKTPAQESGIADHFSVSTLRRFAQSRGWTVESCGSHIAFWRSGKIVPAAEREAFLREVVDLYRALAQPAKSPSDANLEVATTEFDQTTLTRRMAGLIAGALGGMLLAAAICVPLLIAMPFDTAKWFVLAWPIVGMALMAIGAYVGSRLAGGNRDEIE